LSSYKRNNLLTLVTTIVFFFGALMYLWNKMFLYAGLLLLLGLIWLFIYRKSQRPYVVIEKDKMILAQKMMAEPRAYDLAKLSLAEEGKGYLKLIYRDQGAEEEVTVVLVGLGASGGAALSRELSALLKNDQK
jgi:hypothetical protein